MDREKLNKAAEDLADKYGFNDFDKASVSFGFKDCADWLMQQPLSDRLTDEEKEQIRNYHRVLTRDKSVAICNRSYDGIAGADAMLFSLEQIFGSDLFKEK